MDEVKTRGTEQGNQNLREVGYDEAAIETIRDRGATRSEHRQLIRKPRQGVTAARGLFNAINPWTTNKADLAVQPLHAQAEKKSDATYTVTVDTENVQKLAETQVAAFATRLHDVLKTPADTDVITAEQSDRLTKALVNYWTQEKGMLDKKSGQLLALKTFVPLLAEIVRNNPDALNALAGQEWFIGTPNQFAEGIDPLTMALAFPEYQQRLLTLQENIMEALLAHPDTGTLEAYDWNKEQARTPRAIMRTPYVESLLRQMKRAATEQKNGLLKFVLYGEAGLGKTRLAEEFARDDGKRLMVINFHAFINFDDLVAQASVAVDLKGGQMSKADQMGKIKEEFLGLEAPAFWSRMENIFSSLSSAQQERYGTVEGLVDQFGGITLKNNEAKDQEVDVDVKRQQLFSQFSEKNSSFSRSSHHGSPGP